MKCYVLLQFQNNVHNLPNEKKKKTKKTDLVRRKITCFLLSAAMEASTETSSTLTIMNIDPLTADDEHEA